MADAGLIVVALVFVLLNGFFVAAEFAMVKLRYTRVQMLEHTAGWRGAILAKVHTHLDAYLSACQLGITLASLGLGWVGEPAFSHLLTPLLHTLDITSAKIISMVSLSSAFLIISFLHIVVGELMPKTIAIRQAEKISLWTAIPLYWFYWLAYPAIYCLNATSNALLRLFRLDALHKAEHAYTSEEIKLILKLSQMHGELEKVEADMIEQTLNFADLQVKDVMRSVKELITLDASKPLVDNINLMITHRYSRYPVYKGSMDNVLGVVHSKDYLIALNSKDPIPSLTDTMHEPIKIAPTDSALVLLQSFRKGTTHLALVYSNKKLIGFLTLDNLLQVILGHIKDEFHLTSK